MQIEIPWYPYQVRQQESIVLHYMCGKYPKHLCLINCHLPQAHAHLEKK